MEHRKGTLQGDYSRFLFDPRKHYSAVRMQQGRVMLDADWNAQADLLDHRLRTGTLDVVGTSGAPADRAGFAVRVERALELGVHYVVIGTEEGLKWPDLDPSELEAGYLFELRVRPMGPGTLFSRWLRGEERFEPAERLLLETVSEEGQDTAPVRPKYRLRFHRTGAPNDLLSDALDLGDRVVEITVVCRRKITAIHVDGKPVVKAEGHETKIVASKLVVGAHGDDTAPQEPQADLLGMCLRSGRDGRLLGDWSFSAGGLVVDETPYKNDGVISGAKSLPKWKAFNPTVTAGRYYLEGVLCENEGDVPYEDQPDYPGAVFPDPGGNGEESHLFYLDVWQRSISALEDPQLREVALGGPTTTRRSRTIAQVKSLRVRTFDSAKDAPAADPPARDEPAKDTPAMDCPVKRLDEALELPEWQELLERQRCRGRLRARHTPDPGMPLDNLLYRVEVHHGGRCYGRRAGAAEGVHARVEGKRELSVPRQDEVWRAGQPIEIFRAFKPDETADVLAFLASDAREDQDDPRRQILTLDRDSGFDPNDELRIRPVATFKWSRDNASESYPIEDIDGSLVTLSPTVDGEGCLRGGETWIELVNDVTALRREPGYLYLVKSFDPSLLEVDLVQNPPPGFSIEPQDHPQLRIWNQKAPADDHGVIVARTCDKSWYKLEAGIEVRFVAHGDFVSGDFWWILARNSNQDIEWPSDEKKPKALPPVGVDQLLSPVAFLGYQDGGFCLEDLRRTFHDVATGWVSKAGDVMEGPLEIRSDLKVRGRLEVEGDAHFSDIYGRIASHGVVGTPQLADGAVTLQKLSAEVGVVPQGYSILGPTTESPPGYTYTGFQIHLFTDETRWIDRLEIPNFSRDGVHSVAAGGRVYSFQASGDAWEYDPASNDYRRLRDMPWPRRSFTVAAVEEKIYVMGGIDAAGRTCAETFEYDPAADEWTERTPMPTRRCDLSAAVFDGRIHVFGGLRRWPLFGRFVTTRHEAYDPLTDSWLRKRRMPRALCGTGTAALGNRIHVVGGEGRLLFRRWFRQLVARHDVYHPSTDDWLKREEPLPTPRRNVGLVEVFGRLYAIGGRGALGWLDDSDRFDPAFGRWVAQTPLHESVRQPGVATTGGKLYVIGARRSPESEGALVEECGVGERFYLHRRDYGPLEPRSYRRTLKPHGEETQSDTPPPEEPAPEEEDDDDLFFWERDPDWLDDLSPKKQDPEK